MNKAGVATVESPGLGRLKAAGARAWPDLVFYLPRRYKDYSNFQPGFAAAHGTGAKACLKLTVHSKSAYDRQGTKLESWNRWRAFRLSMKVEDAAGEAGWVTVFGNTFPWKDVGVGDEVEVAGEVVVWRDQWQLRNAELIPAEYRGRLVAVYPQKPGYLTSTTVAKGVAYALDHHLADAVAQVCDAVGLPETVLDRLIPFPEGLRGVLFAVHTPNTLKQSEEARIRIRRLAAMQILKQGREIHNRADDPASAVPIESTVVRELAARLPFPLTEDQRKAINEIVLDLRSVRPMRRLLTGDVGCGKSLCFQIPAVACQRLGKRVTLLAPNQLMVDQLAEEIARFFPGTPVEKVTAECKPSEASLAVNPILVGTTALLNWTRARSYAPDFLVVDEQHKHSRDMREALARTNLLEATATPIPRSLALITHGGMEVSILKQSLVKKQIETRTVSGTEEARLVDFVRRALQGNWKVAVVYGRVEDDEESDIRSIEAELTAWEKRFPGRVGVVHGRLNGAEKESVIRRLRSGEISLLVSSTVIELGLTLPSLRALVVVDAEMFGLSTLHQLRGRVARDGGRGKFLMFLPKDVSEEARERINALVQTGDGFAIAEADMQSRGFGDLSADSEAQTGDCGTLFSGVTVTPVDLQEANTLLSSMPQRGDGPAIRTSLSATDTVRAHK